VFLNSFFIFGNKKKWKGARCTCCEIVCISFLAKSYWMGREGWVTPQRWIFIAQFLRISFLYML
jgi:hypothetical protein